MPVESDSQFIEKAAFAIGDRYRLAILQEIARQGEICCLQAQNLTGLAQATCSHHLKLLSESDLVISRKEGKHNLFRLHHENFSKVSAFLAQLSGSDPVE